jgi:hypothetical protein
VNNAATGYFPSLCFTVSILGTNNGRPYEIVKQNNNNSLQFKVGLHNIRPSGLCGPLVGNVWDMMIFGNNMYLEVHIRTNAL